MTVLGKRKAPEPSISEEEAQEIFRRHFEARFQPLSETKEEGPEARHVPDDKEEDTDNSGGQSASGDEESEWDGLSDDEEFGGRDDDAPKIEVVDHSSSQTPKAATTMSKRELKAFMSSRPPTQTTSSSTSSTATTKPSSPSTLPEDAPSLLAQDLELRRLISESHLLAPNRSTSLSSIVSSAGSPSANGPKAFSTGRIRQKAVDLRIQALGSKTSILKQEKMPMHMRKGINTAVATREAKRRREAKENGVILEREIGGKRNKKRDRGGGGGVDMPGVGRLRGAELRISERDVKSIEGTRDTFGRKGKR